MQFAYGRTADDLIEELLDAEPTPRNVTVVSNDSRLIESARRTGSQGWGCQQFQGELVGAPMSAADFEAWVKAR